MSILDVHDMQGGEFGTRNEKMRIVQELVPGKQVTMAHVIASPDPII